MGFTLKVGQRILGFSEALYKLHVEKTIDKIKWTLELYRVAGLGCRLQG